MLSIAFRQPLPMHHRWSGLILFSSLGLVGCDRQEVVHSYRVPKPDVVYELNHTEDSQQPGTAPAASRPERMLAAVVTQPEQGWFFKLSGPPELMEKQVEPFDNFIRSLKFAGGQPKWTLPAQWKETAGSGMRFATLEIDAGGTKPLDLSVISLPRGEESENAYLLANINRWRGQLQLPPIEEKSLGDETRKVELPGAVAYVVDLRGATAGSGMSRAPFAGGSGALPPTMSQPGGAKPAARAPQMSLKYDTPEGWQAGRTDGLRKAAFDVTDGDAKVEITVIDLEPVAAAALPNINRWRGQIDLPEQTQAELDSELKSLPIGGKQGKYVVLEGPSKDGKPQTILGVIVEHSGKAWFIKLMGDAALAAREREHFEAFVKSIQFGAREDGGHGK